MLKFLLVVIVFAILFYLTTRAIQRRGVLPPERIQRIQRHTRPRPPARPVSPDDDEEFLRDLDRRRLHPEDPDS